MQIFLSYASDDKQIAEQVYLALAAAGHSVFFDRESLPAGGDYHGRIRISVQKSDILVFLVSPASVASGSYALTELKYARQKWANPTARILPVIVRSTAWEAIPNYLKAVTVLEPEGNIAAELVVAVEALSGVKKLEAPTGQLHICAIEPVASFLGDTGQMTEVAFSPDGSLLATSGNLAYHNEIHLWHLGSRCLLRKLDPPDGNCLPVFSPDGAIIAATDLGRIITWRVSDGKRSVVWDPRDDFDLWAGHEFAISPDGQTLVSYEGEELLVFSTTDWHLHHRVKFSNILDDYHTVEKLTFSPNGMLAVVLPSMVKLINTQHWQTVQVYQDRDISGEILDVSNVAFSGDGELLAMTSDTRSTVSLWMVSNAQKMQELPGHIGGVVYPKFLGNSRILITGGRKDGFVRFWRAEDMQLLFSISAAENMITSFDVSPDLTSLVTAGYGDGVGYSIRLWHIR